MKIIHTADWHIGKYLYAEELIDDFQLFKNFLVEYIRDHDVNVVIVSGDIFDQANPSNTARTLYFETLNEIHKSGASIVLTAGNHDSISHLESPKELLDILQIKVVGKMSSYKAVHFKEKSADVVIAPIPYLQEHDLRKFTANEAEHDRISAQKQSLINVFTEVSDNLKKDFPDSIHVGMGHLYVQGSTMSESEREIQVGKQDGVKKSSLEGLFDYLALGHIHKPQVLSSTMRYCGSPLQLSFSERNDKKGFVLLDIQNKEIIQTFVEVPIARVFKKLEGSLHEVKLKISALVEEVMLTTLVEINFEEEIDTVTSRINISDFISSFSHPLISFAKTNLSYKNTIGNLSHLFSKKTDLDELEPIQVFTKRVEQEAWSDEDNKLVMEAFDAILYEVQTENLDE